MPNTSTADPDLEPVSDSSPGRIPVKETWTGAQRRRMAWLLGGGTAFLLLLPLIPTMAHAFGGSSAAAHVAAPTVVHVDVVAPGTTSGGAHIQAPAPGAPFFVSCPSGRALNGGFWLPEDPTVLNGNLMESAPDEQYAQRWNFRYSGALPVGTKLYVSCWND